MTHTTGFDEQVVLDVFYANARHPGEDRIDLLRWLGNIRLERPTDWSEHEIREAVSGVRKWLTADRCWACFSGERHIYWHHVIWVSHGGSSHPRNMVPVCHRCHRLVHPWLPAPTTRENRFGWTAVRDIAISGQRVYRPSLVERQVADDDQPF